MVTYPSTHGVFEDTITDLCALVHDAGGQVYVDGANLNALVGVAQPGVRCRRVAPEPAQDVLHPARRRRPRRRPGRGARPPRAVPAQPPARPEAGPETGVGPVSRRAVRLGEHPADLVGLRPAHGRGRAAPATEVAVLNANYVAARLREHYPVLYSGHDGLVAHECILDLRGITKDTGVTVDDVAKRLIDYGFHAPTMSFPVAGTLMVEPTESEDKAELDRFCDAMIAIRARSTRWVGGWSPPPTACCATPRTPPRRSSASGTSLRPRTAAFPDGVDATAKYWPPVRRIDGAYGDRHLVCSCPSPEAFED